MDRLHHHLPRNRPMGWPTVIALGFLLLVFTAVVVDVVDLYLYHPPPFTPLPPAAPTSFYRVENVTLYYLNHNNERPYPSSVSVGMGYKVIRSGARPLTSKITITAALAWRNRFIILHIGRFTPNSTEWSEDFKETVRLTSQQAYDLLSVLRTWGEPYKFELRISEIESEVTMICPIEITRSKKELHMKSKSSQAIDPLRSPEFK